MSAATNDVHRHEQRLIKKGIEQDAFELALKIKRNLGIEKALELSEFSHQELEKEKLDR